MEEITNKQHVQLPTLSKLEILAPKELYTYLVIKKYMNKDTHEAYPSMTLLCEQLDASENTIKKYIDNLEKAGYLKAIREKGKRNIYIFNKEKLEHFEPFSYEFLDNKDLSVQAKMLYVVTQQYLFMDEESRTGSTNYCPTTLSKLIKMSPNSIIKYQKELIDKGYLKVIEEKNNYPVPVIQSKVYPKKTYTYDIDKLQQQIIFVLKTHEERLNTLTENQTKADEKIQTLENEQKEIKQLLINLLEKI